MATARVLVVDDDSTLLDVVSRVLTRAGYEVLPANGAHQALEIVSNHHPYVDLVVSDLEMPAMQGTQLVREVAQISPQTAGLLMTGGILEPADVPNGVPVLQKPFAMSDLISAVEATLARSAQLSADFRRTCERSGELRQQSRKLLSEAVEARRRSRDLRKNCGNQNPSNRGGWR
ncbi:MAG TPA: response regulator [Bryobacteraceae bacterium]|jgi:DNA-binding NtrC family response regulator